MKPKSHDCLLGIMTMSDSLLMPLDKPLQLIKFFALYKRVILK